MSNKESVKLRQRKLRTGNVTLYLDIYRRGVREYEYLKLYLIPETNRESKEKNRQTLRLAEAIRAKRSVELLNGEYGFRNKRDDVLFYPYATMLTERRKTPGTMQAMIKYLRAYDGRETLTFADINKRWVEGFVRYLDSATTLWDKGRKLAANSKHIYWRMFKSIINHAKRNEIIIHDPTAGIEAFRKEETRRSFLTLEEIGQLTGEPCAYDDVKRAFLFACLTGMRRSDIWKLTWSEVHTQGAFTRIVFRQQKTGGQEYLDITPQAVTLLGKQGEPGERVFRHLISPNHANEVVRRWVLRAGIQKDITFHCARHSFAIMMLDIGTDIYTVSKLLGHKDLATTQIYAKVLDRKKQEAVANIPNVFNL